MKWNITDDRPIWIQLQEQLTMGILSGEYPMGSRLPSVRDLAADAGVNPNTMQRALGAMEGSGLLTTHRTAGRHVTEHQERIDSIRKELAKAQIAAYLEGMQTLGFSEEEAKRLLWEEETWKKN